MKLQITAIIKSFFKLVMPKEMHMVDDSNGLIMNFYNRIGYFNCLNFYLPFYPPYFKFVYMSKMGK